MICEFRSQLLLLVFVVVLVSTFFPSHLFSFAVFLTTNVRAPPEFAAGFLQDFQGSSALYYWLKTAAGLWKIWDRWRLKTSMIPQACLRRLPAACSRRLTPVLHSGSCASFGGKLAKLWARDFSLLEPLRQWSVFFFRLACLPVLFVFTGRCVASLGRRAVSLHSQSLFPATI